MAVPPEANIDALVARLAAAGPAYRAKTERALRRLQAVLKAPKPIRWLAGDLEAASKAEVALRLELALLEALHAGTLVRVKGPAGDEVWEIPTPIVRKWFTKEEVG